MRILQNCFYLIMLITTALPVYGQFDSNVTRVGGYTVGREVIDLVISGDWAYCADEYGLSVWDLSQLESPVEVARCPTPGWSMCVAVQGDYAYIGDHLRGLAVINISNPLHPRIIEYLDLQITSGYYISRYKIVIRDSVLFLSGSQRLWIISIEDPEMPELISISNPPWPQITDIAVFGNIVYLSTTNYEYGLLVLSIEDLEAPELLRMIECPRIGGIRVRDSLLYCVGQESREELFAVYNLINPEEPELLGRFDDIQSTKFLYLDGDRAYTGGDREYHFLIIDISNPRQVEIIARHEDVVYKALAKKGDYLFSAAKFWGIQVTSVADPDDPVIVNEEELFFEHNIIALDVKDDVAYIQDEDWGFHILDVSDVQDLSFIAERMFEGRGNTGPIIIKRHQDYVYTGFPTRQRAISIFNVDNLEEPEYVREIAIQANYGRMFSAYIREGYAYITGDLWSGDYDVREQNLVVLNLEDPSNPEVIEWRQESRSPVLAHSSLDGTLIYQIGQDTPGDPDSYVLVYSLEEPGNIEYIGRWSRGDYDEILVHNQIAYVYRDYEIGIYNVENPTQPRAVGNIDIGVRVSVMCLEGDIIYLGGNQAGFGCLSIADPENPELVGYYDTPGNVRDMKSIDGYLYVCDYFELGVYDCAEIHGIWNLDLSAESYDFGEVHLNTDSTFQLSISNLALQPVDILDISSDSAVFTVDFDSAFTIEPDEEANIEVTFTPTEQLLYTGKLTIVTERRDLIVKLSGTGVDLSAAEDELLPFEYKLYPAYPNPFNSTTTITYGLAKAAPTRIAIYDLTGRDIVTLVNGTKDAGSYRIHWDANVPSGIYVCRMETGGFCQSRKLVLVR